MTELPSQLDEILDLFGRLGIEIRYEPLGGNGGGLCNIRGKAAFFVDADADTATTIDHALDALATMPQIDGLFLI